MKNKNIFGNIQEGNASVIIYHDIPQTDCCNKLKVLNKIIQYYKDKKIISDDPSLAKKPNVPIDISGTKIRENIINNKQIPTYLMRTDLSQIVQDMYNKNPDDVFHQ